MIFIKIILILFCIGFMWGMYIDPLRPYWHLRAVIGGFLFAGLIITLPICLYNHFRNKSIDNYR